MDRSRQNRSHPPAIERQPPGISRRVGLSLPPHNQQHPGVWLFSRRASGSWFSPASVGRRLPPDTQHPGLGPAPGQPIPPDHLTTEESQRVEHLILGAGRHAPFHRRVNEKLRHLGRVHLPSMRLALNEYVAPTVKNVSPLRPAPAIPDTQHPAHAFQERRRLSLAHRRFSS